MEQKQYSEEEATELLKNWSIAYEKAIKDAMVYGTGFLAVDPDGNITHFDALDAKAFDTWLESSENV